MIGIDTNVLVRYLTSDDEIQSNKAAKLINQYIGQAGSIFINNIVACELIWVLERGYKYDKSHITTVLKEIVATSEFQFEDHKILWLSIVEYEKSNVDFADILIGNINALKGCSKSFTFDSKASALLVFDIVE